MCVPGNVDMTVHRVNLTGESVEDYFDTVLARGFRWQPDQGPATGEGSHSPAVVWSPLVLELMEVLETVTLHPPAQHLCRETFTTPVSKVLWPWTGPVSLSSRRPRPFWRCPPS